MDLTYRELPPSRRLAHLVRSYWAFSVAEGVRGPIRHEVIPDGCVSLSFWRAAEAGGGRLRIVGPRTEFFAVPVWGGQEFWGARLAPAACEAVLGIAPAALRELVADLAEIAPEFADGLGARLSECGCFDDAVAAYAAAFEALGIAPERIDGAASAAAAEILASGGTAPIAEIATRVGLGVRQLERRFGAAVGLTPKQFARVHRVRTTAKLRLSGEAETWAACAAEMGFTDQAHMTREFRAATGRPPKRFERKIREIAHGELAD